MMDTLQQHVRHWLSTHPLSPSHTDCTTAVMLKILDGKCKMGEQEKLIMAELYQQSKHRPGIQLGDDIHQLIALAHTSPDEALLEYIYEKRVLAETMISRPVMKGFKAMIRETGLVG